MINSESHREFYFQNGGKKRFNAMKPNIFILLTVSLFFAACQANAPANSPNRNAAGQTPAQTANPSPTAFEKPKIETFDGSGAVTKINLELGSIELDHEEIKGAMPAMRMEFYVSDKKMLKHLNVGDRVDFVLENNQGAERIIGVKKK